MPDALTSILPVIQAVTGGAGLVGNILNSVQQGNVAKQAEKNASLTPGQLGSMVTGAEQPLNASLVQAINNQVQGDVASRGLAQAPGVFAAEESQALAPFEQQNQQVALQLILEKLGIPLQTLQAMRSGGGGFANLSPLLQSIMKLFPNASSATPTLPFGNYGPLPPTTDTSTPSLTTPNNFTGSTDVGTGDISA